MRSSSLGVLVRRLDTTYDWEAVVIDLTGGPDPHSGITVWHSGEELHLWYPNQPEPATEWEAELDEIYIGASQELDSVARVEHYHRAQEVVAENVPPHLHDSLRATECGPERVWQSHSHAIWALKYPLLVQNGPLARRFQTSDALRPTWDFGSGFSWRLTAKPPH